jgi:uncharacterized protein YbbK (DUF523 family)
MNILVSACLMGENCKYNGSNNLNQNVVDYLKGHTVMELCPEMLAGMDCPRACAEIVNGRIMTEHGEDVDAQYRRGVALALQQMKGSKIDLAILQSRSPTCGVNSIYDGTFSGKLIEGQGLFAKSLCEMGIRVVDSEEF